MNEQLKKLWAVTKLKVWPEAYYILKFQREALAAINQQTETTPLTFVAIVIDELELSVTCSEDQLERLKAVEGFASSSAAMSVITFDIALEFDVVGYMAVAAEALAKAEVSIIPQCAFSRDHLLIAAPQRDKAIDVLNRLIANAASE